MAEVNQAPAQPWPNDKESYELKEVIGEFKFLFY